MASFQIVTMADGTGIAFREDGSTDEVNCGFFWLGGFKSDMEGTKAEAIAALARDTRRASLRFDYSGHGQSQGLFTDGTISGWLGQNVHMFTKCCHGPRIVVGSSMGGWLALLLLRQLLRQDPKQAERIQGLVLIAPACDMTADLMWDTFGTEARDSLNERGLWWMPSRYGEPYPITARLIEDGKRHLMLKDGLDCPCPVRILQGDQDLDVPAPHAVKTFGALRGSDITLTLIKGGDHRLSAPSQIALIRETALRLAERAGGIIV